ncbi:hypothetical protein ACQKP7_01900 [Pseudomonas frederiksbergensis]|uniref:hypothetical protein n=1 Tax=Pseudomonas frederiksbergensis TaxID=104087 RepID=UPI003CFDD20E
MLPYIATYLFIAFILAIIDRFTDRPLFIRTHLKQLPWKLNYSIRWWGPQECWSAITLGSVVVLFMLMFWMNVGGSVNKDIGRFFLVVICISSVVLSVRHFNLIAKFKAHAWWMTLLTALITLGFGLLASAFADSFILNRTRIDAAQFPVAQKTLTTLILVFFWASFATVLISVAVLVVSFFMSITAPTFFETIKREHLVASHWKAYKRGIIDKRRSLMLSSVFIGAIFTVLIALTYWEYILQHAEDVIQETLVFSSFHLHPRDCAIPGAPQDSWAALVSDGRAVIATPSRRGYTFETLPCHMQSATEVRNTILQRLKLDDYF